MDFKNGADSSETEFRSVEEGFPVSNSVPKLKRAQENVCNQLIYRRKKIISGMEPGKSQNTLGGE
jgi:hypothetical protein